MPGRWAGRWLMGVAIIHTVFGIAAFGTALRTMAGIGLWNSVGEDPMRGAVAWFMLFGFLLFITGIDVDGHERHGRSCQGTGWGLLVMSVIGIVLMPVSGFWLVLPASMALIARGRTIYDR